MQRVGTAGWPKENLMRTFLLTIIVCSGSASSALADPMELAPPDAPAACVALSKVPSDATSPIPALGARIATASCLAEARFNALKLAPDDASIAALTEAAKPSLALLDAAIQENDPVMTPIAQRARADLFVSMVVRMRSSIAPITMQTVGPRLLELDQQHAALEPKLQPWLAQLH